MNYLDLTRESVVRDIARGIGADVNDGPWIAGGAARRLYEFEDSNDPAIFDTGDIDIFLPIHNNLVVSQRAKEFISGLCSFGGFVESRKTGTLSGTFMGAKNKIVRVQIIAKDYASKQHLFETFDFTVTQFAAGADAVAYPESSAHDLLAKRLRLAEPIQERKFYTPNRVAKYCAYGFTPTAGVLAWAIDLANGTAGEDMSLSWNGNDAY